MSEDEEEDFAFLVALSGLRPHHGTHTHTHTLLDVVQLQSVCVCVCVCVCVSLGQL